MRQFIDLTEQKFNKLTAIKYIGKDKWGSSNWLCRCDCGNEKIVRGSHLIYGHTKSCGCLLKEHKGRPLKYWHPKINITSNIYMIWAGMIQRCTNSNNKAYKNYGGRGIKVCDRWLKFENFYKDVGDPPEGLTLDRINNNGNYEPNNWRFATRKKQNRNTRKNHLFTYNNEIKCLPELSEKYNINIKTLTSRLNKDLSIKEALTIPVRKHKKYKKRKMNNGKY